MDQWLSILRIGLGIAVVCYTWSLREDWNFLFAGTANGLIGRDFSEALLARQSPFVPRLGWIVSLGASVELGESAVLSIAWWLLFMTGCALIAGVFSRSLAILAWFVHLCASKSGELVAYGVDNFITIGLFYLMLAPLPDRYAYENRWRRTRDQDRQLLGFWRRALQVHLCFIYFFGGLSKALGSGWWTGESLWSALTRPPFNVIPVETLIDWKHFLPIAGIIVCVLEVGYPFAIWPVRTRLGWLIGIVATHTAIGLAMGMYLFSLVMIVLNLAAFGPAPAEGLWPFPQTFFITSRRKLPSTMVG